MLLEDKIDAPAQPEQAARYSRRGENGINNGWWHKFTTCIVAPQKYLDTASDAKGYQTQLSYEELGKWFESLAVTDSRYEYKGRIINEAIEQNRRGYQSVDHAAVHAFWQQYRGVVKDEFPELKMAQVKDRIPVGSDWPHLFAADVRKGRRVVHKWNQGNVDLEIPLAAKRIEDIQRLNANTLGTDMVVVKTGKAASIRAEVPQVDRFGDFGAQIEKIRTGLCAAKKLLSVSPKLVMP